MRMKNYQSSTQCFTRCFVLIFLLVTTTTANTANNTIAIGYLGPATYATSGLFTITEIGSAVVIAIEKINNNQTLLPNHNLTFVYNDSACNDKIGLSVTEYQVRNAGVKGIVGPACSPACEVAGLVGSLWKIPIISYVSTSGGMSNHAKFDTFTRTSSPLTLMVDSLLRVMDHFNWTRIGIIYDFGDKRIVWGLIRTAMISKLDPRTQSKYTLNPSISADISNADDATIDSLLLQIRSKARIVLLSANRVNVRKILLRARALGMTNGDYVFISFEVNISYDYGFKNTTWLANDGRNAEALEAFRSLLIFSVVVDFSSDYPQFRQNVKTKLHEPPFNVPKNENITVGVYAGLLHDAVLMYAHAAHATLQSGGSIDDGVLVTKNMIKTPFTGVTGLVALNENGDRELNYGIFDLRNASNGADLEFVMVKKYQSYNGKMIDVVKDARIEWSANNYQIPLDAPACGFNNEKCSTQNQLPIILGSSFGGFALLCLIAGYILYRRMQYVARLSGMVWKIHSPDLLSTRTGTSSHFGSGGSISRHSQTSTVSNLHQLFTKVARYKNSIVAVKEIERTKKLELTRNVMKEFQTVYDLHCNNINPFIGAVIEDSKIQLITQYCPRGSLQDVLENNDIDLDIKFKISFASDIIKGMIFLHGCDIKSHGNLKSSNCLVDSRWVVKIADFGIASVRKLHKIDHDHGEHANYSQLYWTAPELLRMPVPPLNGTQPGDVYSFAIILQEIVERGPPYCNSRLTPKEIINKISQEGDNAIYRPEIPDTSCPPEIKEIILQCWNEQPSLRPPFTMVKKMIRKSFGKDTDIMENMVGLLERYANNLEDIVKERTQQLVEEKKRTDELLYRMMPRSVAEQLKKGLVVEAETFNEVTVYFSDIVGFTNISAASTPMEVVVLLNDLYTLFDEIIKNYDVYKVETIGDAYMVVSGLPIRNGSRHVREIANMALELLANVKRFHIRHMPDDKLKLRIGIHSGPVVAGVVGKSMPRYCLFGDTVNTASRMESYGEAFKIHISESTSNLLQDDPDYETVPRGGIEVKGKGIMTTFWLETSKQNDATD